MAIQRGHENFTQFVRRCVIAIQGGGVYGISLLGQLQAVEDQRIRADALAGTSAGAIIATLYWVGYTPRQILSILKRWAREGELLSLLGPPDPHRQLSLQDFTSLFRARPHKHSSSALQVLRRVTRRWKVLPTAIRRLYGFSGLYDGTILEKRLDELIRGSPLLAKHRFQLPTSGKVTFGDISRVLGERSLSLPILFLTMTNLNKRELVIANSREEKYNDLELARVVRASAGFPGAFVPVPIAIAGETCFYSDGGIVLNFPAYAFIKEYRKLISPKLPYVTIGLRLGPGPNSAIDCARPKGCYAALFRLLTGEARSWLESELSEASPYSIVVRQPLDESAEAPSNVMAVNELTEERIQKMFDAARCFAQRRLAGCEFGLPSAEVGTSIEQRLAQLVQECAVILNVPDAAYEHTLRSNIFLACSGTTRAGESIVRLVLTHSCNMQGDPDEQMVFQLHQGLVGLVFSLREPLWCDPTKFLAETQPGGSLHIPGSSQWTPELNVRVRKDRNYLVSVPILDPTHLGTELADAAKRTRPPSATEGPGHGGFQSPRLEVGRMPPFGVLALDGHFQDPQLAASQVRLAAVVSCMQLASLEIGLLLAYAFHPMEK